MLKIVCNGGVNLIFHEYSTSDALIKIKAVDRISDSWTQENKLNSLKLYFNSYMGLNKN